MSRHNLTTATFAVWIETNRFKPEEPQRDASRAVRLPVATADTGKLIAGATSLRCVLSRDQVRRPLATSGVGRVAAVPFAPPDVRSRSESALLKSGERLKASHGPPCEPKSPA
jgi:hypothetical protein